MSYKSTFKRIQLLSISFIMVFAGSAYAQGGSGSSTTTTSTSSTSTSSTSSATSTTNTTVTSTTVSSTSTTQPDETTTTIAPLEGIDPDLEIDPDFVDPLLGEGKLEEVPESDIEVPEPDTYNGQKTYQPPEILWSSVEDAEVKFNEFETKYVSAIEVVHSLRLRSKFYDVEVSKLDKRSAEILEESEELAAVIEARAVVDFIMFSGGETKPIGSEPSIAEMLEKNTMDSLLKLDQSKIEEHNRLRKSLGVEINILLDKRKGMDSLVEKAEDIANDFRVDRDQAQIEYEAFKAGSEVYVQGVVFPIGGPYSNPIIDSFGFPRMPGTADAHWHEGIDIFAPRGTPLVAAERGVVTSVGSNRLGGLKVWLKGESGVEWYYAHLEGFAPGLAVGQLKEAGDLLGYVGDSGNAKGTPPHLHMQMHPGGGRPINPYPLLNMVSQTEQSYIENGIQDGYAHKALSRQ